MEAMLSGDIRGTQSSPSLLLSGVRIYDYLVFEYDYLVVFETHKIDHAIDFGYWTNIVYIFTCSDISSNKT